PPAAWISFLLAGAAGKLQINYGASPPAGWIVLLLFVFLLGFSLVIADTRRSRRRVIAEMQGTASPAEQRPADKKSSDKKSGDKKSDEKKSGEKKPVAAKTPLLDPQGLPYPHPIINVATCIGCHACVDACPHDVLAIINGKSALVAVEQCMEDT